MTRDSDKQTPKLTNKQQNRPRRCGSFEQDKPIERELAGGESHSYRITLASGQYARVAVDQRHINNEADLLNNICVVQNNMGEPKKAIDTCNKALSIRRDLNDRQGEATALNNLGNA